MNTVDAVLDCGERRMLKNTNSKLVEQMLQRQNTYHNICEKNWKSLCDIINGLLQIGTEQAWDKLGFILNKQELQIYELFYNEWNLLKQAYTIYQSEKEHKVSCTIFENTVSINDLEKKLNCLKFGLLRLDNQIPIDKTFEAEWRYMRFSDIAIKETARDVCNNAECVIESFKYRSNM